jgi:hypothetical protein
MNNYSKECTKCDGRCTMCEVSYRKELYLVEGFAYLRLGIPSKDWTTNYMN